MKNVQKETRNQEMRLKDFGCKALDAIEMLVVLATAALLLIGSAVTTKAEPVSGQHEKKDSENLHKYRLQKITDGKRTVRKQHYNIQPHDIIVYESRKHETAGCHCNGARVMILPDKKSVSIKKIKIYKYAGGYFKSAFN